jgi:hypothetical protein
MGKAEVGQEGRQEKGEGDFLLKKKNEAPVSRPQHAELRGKGMTAPRESKGKNQRVKKNSSQ